MKIKEIFRHIENWAPKGIAWENDNPGLQVGSPEIKVRNILICLDLTREIVQEAITKKCNLIISHHPLLFRPIKKIQTSDDPTSQLIELLLKNNITLYSAHTNLDFTKNGVSFELAKKLRLMNISFLKTAGNTQFKLVVFLPQSHVSEVSDALFSAGAGVIGEYSRCSYRLDGRGTFLGSDLSNPSAGKKGRLEEVPEIRLEVIVDKWNIEEIIKKMKAAHPYEEPAYDIYPLTNPNSNFGFGAIGEYEEPVRKDIFLSDVCRILKIPAVKHSESKARFIQKVAVCGGSGSELLPEAIRSGADAFITADIKYHTYFDAHDNILLIDGGHFETEVVILAKLKKYIEEFTLAGSGVCEVMISRNLRNPVKVFNKTQRSI
ncbi:MAG: Nif3-like dinuclear metal center hexameric protein [Ignavibacteriaceae bacterium]